MYTFLGLIFHRTRFEYEFEVKSRTQCTRRYIFSLSMHPVNFILHEDSSALWVVCPSLFRDSDSNATSKRGHQKRCEKRCVLGCASSVIRMHIYVSSSPRKWLGLFKRIVYIYRTRLISSPRPSWWLILRCPLHRGIKSADLVYEK